MHNTETCETHVYIHGLHTYMVMLAIIPLCWHSSSSLHSGLSGEDAYFAWMLKIHLWFYLPTNVLSSWGIHPIQCNFLHLSEKSTYVIEEAKIAVATSKTLHYFTNGMHYINVKFSIMIMEVAGHWECSYLVLYKKELCEPEKWANGADLIIFCEFRRIYLCKCCGED